MRSLIGSVATDRLGIQSIRVERRPSREKTSSLLEGVGMAKSLSTLLLSGWILTSPLGWAVTSRPLKVTWGAILNLEVLNLRFLAMAWVRTWVQRLYASEPLLGWRRTSLKILMLLSKPERTHLL